MNLSGIHIRKNAGSSIHQQFLQQGIPCWTNAGHLYDDEFGEDSYKINPGRPFSYEEEDLSFAVIRNPYDRALSGYNYLMRNEPKFLENKSFLEILEDLGSFKKETSTYNKFGTYWRHLLAPQYEYVYNRGKLSVDFILRFENIQEDWKKLCEMIDIPHKPLWTKNAAEFVTKKEFTEREIEVLQKHFKKDFEYFGYDINDIPRID